MTDGGLNWEMVMMGGFEKQPRTSRKAPDGSQWNEHTIATGRRAEPVMRSLEGKRGRDNGVGAGWGLWANVSGRARMGLFGLGVRVVEVVAGWV